MFIYFHLCIDKNTFIYVFNPWLRFYNLFNQSWVKDRVVNYIWSWFTDSEIIKSKLSIGRCAGCHYCYTRHMLKPHSLASLKSEMKTKMDLKKEHLFLIWVILVCIGFVHLKLLRETVFNLYIVCILKIYMSDVVDFSLSLSRAKVESFGCHFFQHGVASAEETDIQCHLKLSRDSWRYFDSPN